MNPLRRLAALPLTLVLFWMMVVAPWAVARCEHACGETRLHALGATCSADDDCCGHVCPDKEHGVGHEHSCDDGRTGSAGGSPACSPFKADPAAPQDFAPAVKAPAPAVFIPVYPVFLATPLLSGEPTLFPIANAPPDTPPKETHGRGALPLLS